MYESLSASISRSNKIHFGLRFWSLSSSMSHPWQYLDALNDFKRMKGWEREQHTIMITKFLEECSSEDHYHFHGNRQRSEYLETQMVKTKRWNDEALRNPYQIFFNWALNWETRIWEGEEGDRMVARMMCWSE